MYTKLIVGAGCISSHLTSVCFALCLLGFVGEKARQVQCVLLDDIRLRGNIPTQSNLIGLVGNSMLLKDVK